MIGADLTIKLDLPFGAIDAAFLEEIVHRALTEAQVPVVDVEFDGFREVDSPLGPGGGITGPDLPLGPLGAPITRPPGGRF